MLFKYGMFIQTIFEFLLIALALFLVIKGINKLKRPPPPRGRRAAAARRKSSCSPRSATCLRAKPASEPAHSAAAGVEEAQRVA